MPTYRLADDCGLVDVGCEVSSSVHGWLADTAATMARGAARIVGESMTWWTHSDRTSMLQSPAINHIHSLLFFVSMAVLVGSIMWQGVMVMWQRKPDPLVNAGVGLVSYVGWSTLGTTTAIAINEAGIALSGVVLRSSIDRFATTLGAAMQAQVASSVAAALLLAIVLFFLGAIQWILGFFRMGALVILLALLPVAAAGQATNATKPWLRKVLSWALSLLLYQPIAAIVFSIGFLLAGAGRSLSDVLVGMAVLALAVVAMPTMMRFFSWGPGLTTGTAGSGSGVAMGAAASVLGGAQGASGYARYMNEHGPATQAGTTGTGALTVHPANANGEDTDDAARQSAGSQPSAPSTPGSEAATGGSGIPTAAAGDSAAGAGAGAGAAAGGVGAAVTAAGAVARQAQAFGAAAAQEATAPGDDEPQETQ